MADVLTTEELDALEQADGQELSQEELDAIAAEEEAQQAAPPAVPRLRPGSIEAMRAESANPEQVARSMAAGAARLPLGAGQAVTAAAETIGVPGADTANYTEGANDWLSAIRGSNDPDLIERGTEFAIGMLPGLNVPAKSLALVDVAMAGAKSGLLGGATSFSEAYSAAEKWGSLVLSTTLGGAAGLGLGTIGKAREIPRVVVDYLNSKGSKAQQIIAEKFDKYFPELSDDLTMAMRSGSPNMADAEAKAAGPIAQDTYKRIGDTLYGRMKAIEGRYGAPISPTQAATRGMAAARAEASRLAAIRKAEYNAALDLAESAVTTAYKKTGGLITTEQVMIPLDDIEGKLMDKVADWTTSKDALSPAVQQLRSIAAMFKGQIPLDTYIKTLKKLNGDNFNVLDPGSAIGANKDAQRAAGKAFKEVLDDALDKAGVAQDPRLAEALDKVKLARSSYKQRSTEIDMYRDSFTAKTLGLDKFNGDPEVARRAFLQNASPGEQNRMRQVLLRHDPGLLRDMRRLDWEDRINRAVADGEFATGSKFDVPKFLEASLRDGKFRTGGLYSPQETKMMEDMLPAMKAVLYSRGYQQRMFEMESAAMASGTAITNPKGAVPFMIRTGSRLINWMEPALYTPQGREKLMRVRGAIDTPRFNSELGRLASWLNVMDAKQETASEPEAE